MSDQPDDPDRRKQGAEAYPPPMFAPAAPAAPAAAESEAGAGVTAASPEPAAPSVVSGEIESGTATSTRVTSGASAAPPAPPAPPAAPAPPAEEPLLPATYSENDLRSAIGSPPLSAPSRPWRDRERSDHDDDTDGGDAPRRRKAMIFVAAGLFAGLGITALVGLGRLNAGRYAVRCEDKAVIAEQGRSFPPWGTSPLGGDAWKPIPIPPSFQCIALETDDAAELGDAYRKMLFARAESLLTAKEKEPAQLDLAAGLLEQALFHARSDNDQHKSARQEIQRMQGDVGYWRAAAVLQKATAELANAAKQFETAAGQRPRFVSDASAWATHVRKLIEELRVGPAGAKASASASASAPAPAPAAPDRPLAPPGVALPIEPGAGGGSGGSDSAGGGGSGATESGEAAPPAPSAAPDAGVSTGGVLL